MRDKLIRFMQGRYGNDGLNRFLMVVALIGMLLSFVGPKIFYYIALVAIVWAYYRMFSRKIYQRAAENEWYLKKTAKVRSWFQKQKNVAKQLKTHHIYKCPNCKQKIRVPRGRGRIEITCRKCGNKFIRKS